MGHGVEDERIAPPLNPAAAEAVARTLQALATPSRLRILTRLRQGPSAVGELADAIGMEQSAVSHQLRLLRDLARVSRTREGRSTVYALYDGHVAMLLDEAIYHVEHLRLGITDAVDARLDDRETVDR